MARTQKTSRITIVLNPLAGRRAARAIADRFEAIWRARGDKVEVIATEHAGHAVTIARDADCDRMVVLGGDGTLREVASGLGARRATIPVAFVPAGHGNVVARELRIPLDTPVTAAAAVDSERERRLDVGRANGETFLAMVGVGFDVFATRFVDTARRATVGRRLYDLPFGGDLLYGIGGVGGLLRLMPQRFEVTVDGEPLKGRFPTVTVCNTRTYAKGWSLAPAAKPDDGKLDVTAQRRCLLPFQAAALVYAKLRRRMPGLLAAYGRGSRVEILAQRPFRWQLDGDPKAEAEKIAIDLDGPPLRVLLPE